MDVEKLYIWLLQQALLQFFKLPQDKPKKIMEGLVSVFVKDFTGEMRDVPYPHRPLPRVGETILMNRLFRGAVTDVHHDVFDGRATITIYVHGHDDSGKLHKEPFIDGL